MRSLSDKVLDVIKKSDKPMKTDQIAKLLNISQRSVRYALNSLVDGKLINKYFDLEDVRSHYYIRK